MTPKSSCNRVLGIHGNTLKVAVTAAPEKGKANQATIEVIANYFGLKKSQVTLHSGEISRNKRFKLQGITLEQAQKFL